jgi:hypothetical protein
MLHCAASFFEAARIKNDYTRREIVSVQDFYYEAGRLPLSFSTVLQMALGISPESVLRKLLEFREQVLAAAESNKEFALWLTSEGVVCPVLIQSTAQADSAVLSTHTHILVLEHHRVRIRQRNPYPS